MSLLKSIGALALTTVFLFAQTALPTGTRRIVSVEGVTEYRLDNGLTVLLFPDPSKQTITVNMTYLVGSRHEGYGETGMAHLLEHMLFRGTPTHPKLTDEFRKYGAQVNGTTSVDRTNYYETFPASEENLRWALNLEADRMVNSYIAKKDLDQEMTVVRNEFESGENNPFRVLTQRTMAAAFLWHNYGKSTIGSKADLENVPVERLKAFYTKYYQPDNAVLVIAGGIDEPKTIGSVAEIFSKLARPARKLESTYTLDPDQDGERTITIRRVGDIQAITTLYRVPDGSHPDTPALDLLTTIMLDAPSGRLHKALVETGMAANVSGGLWQLREPGVILLGATVRKDRDIKPVRETILRLTHDLVNEPPTKEEVERAKNAELTQIERRLGDSTQLGLYLSESIARGDWRLVFRYREDIKKVTAEDVLRVARNYIKEDNRTIGTFLPVDKPDRALIAPPTDVAAALKDLKLDAEISAGEVFPPTPENIEKRLLRSSLPNGMRLQLLSKKTRGNKVNALVTLRFGNTDETKGKRTAGLLAARMLNRGTAKHTRQQLHDELDRLRTQLFVDGSARSATVSIETTRNNLPDSLKLAAEILREPSFPTTEFEPVKQELLASVEQRRSQPAALADITLKRHVYPLPEGDTRRFLLPDEEIAEIRKTTLEDVKGVYAQFFGGSNGTVTVVGDHDAAEIQRLTAKLFGDWKSPTRYERPVLSYAPVKVLEQSILTPDKANANFTAALPVPIGDDHPDYPALTLANYIFGSGFSGRLFRRIRAQEGLSYGVGSILSGSLKDDCSLFEVFAISAPQNTAKVDAAFREELEKARKEGFTEAELAESRKGYVQSRTVQRSQDAAVARTLSSMDAVDRTMAWQAAFESKVSALTLDQVNAAFRKYIDPASLSYVKAGDFPKASATPQASNR
ncbi:MAG: insulinase family protein [Bryobacteraceae bacterium]|nr:insulinase family protein [Bryobacteraceae bacterium]